MRRLCSAVLFLVVFLLFLVVPLVATFAQSDQVGLTILSSPDGTTFPTPGSYTYDYGTNVTIQASPDNGQSFLHWIIDNEIVAENPITLSMTMDHTVQPVFTQNQNNTSNGIQGFNFNIPSVFILASGIVAIVFCIVGYLGPVGIAYLRKKTPLSVIRVRLILSLICIAIVVGPIGAALALYSGNLSGIVMPSNLNEVSNVFSSEGGFGMPQVMGASFDLPSRTIGVTLNFTNPTKADLTIVACSGYLSDHLDNYSLGQISLISPVDAPPSHTIVFQMTCPLSVETLRHLIDSHSNSSSLDVDVSDEFIDFAGIMLHPTGTMTVHIGSV